MTPYEENARQRRIAERMTQDRADAAASIAVSALSRQDRERLRMMLLKTRGEQIMTFTLYPTVEVKRVNHDAPMLKYAYEGDAGVDLCTMESVELWPHETKMVGTGIAVSIPECYEGTIRPRSGMASKRGVTIANTPGTIDSKYRGEIMLPLHNLLDVPVSVEKGERVAQLLVKLQPMPKFVEVDELDATDRGTNGFGSSGY